MRRWGRVPICKDFIPDHEMGIHTHTIFLRKERKERIRWVEADLRERERSRKTNLQKERRVLASLSFEGELGNKLVMGVRSCWKHFHSKMINGAA
jgi:hypothetical protein